MECSGEGTDRSRRTCRNRGHIVNSVVKNPPANAGDVGFTPGLRRSPAEGNDNPFQCSCLAEEPGGLLSTQSQKSQTPQHVVKDLRASSEELGVCSQSSGQSLKVRAGLGGSPGCILHKGASRGEPLHSPGRGPQCRASLSCSKIITEF